VVIPAGDSVLKARKAIAWEAAQKALRQTREKAIALLATVHYWEEAEKEEGESIPQEVAQATISQTLKDASEAAVYICEAAEAFDAYYCEVSAAKAYGTTTQARPH
jgi:hypothetical protein